MTKEKLYEQGIRADAELGNDYFICKCRQQWRSKSWQDNRCTCGDTADEYHYIAHIEETVNPSKEEDKKVLEVCYDDPVLKQARTEAKSKVTKLQRHLFQCSSCRKTHLQNDYAQSIECSCGGLLVIKYSYIGDTEYYTYGEAVGQQIEPGNFIRQVRKSLRLSQKELAHTLRVNQQFISGMEKGGKQIPQGVIDRLTELYFEE
jgi:hypothetical protein